VRSTTAIDTAPRLNGEVLFSRGTLMTTIESYDQSNIRWLDVAGVAAVRPVTVQFFRSI
jgi:hypothetical protein